MINHKSINVNNKNTLIDGRRKNWFWDSNEVFSSDLSPYAKLVRLYLARCANTDRQAWPSYSKIARDCGMSRKTAQRAVNELEIKGWITKTHQVKGNGEHMSNVYMLCDPPEKEPEPEKETDKEQEVNIKTSEKNSVRGGDSQTLPCHKLHRVGTDSSQVGTHSPQVGSEVPSNNTNITIPIEQEIDLNKQSTIHSSIHLEVNNNMRACAKVVKSKAVDIVDNVDCVDIVGLDSNKRDSEYSASLQTVKSILRRAGFEGLPIEVEYISKWVGVFNTEMIAYAVNKAVLNGIKSLPYVAGIFEDWLKKGVKTIEQAKRETRYDSVLKSSKRDPEREIKLPDPQVFRDYQKFR